MTTNEGKLPLSILDDFHTTGAGFDILRYVTLPEVMGEEAPTLLYFMGKNLARKFEITSVEDLFFIFEKLGIGNLELLKQKNNKKVFHLLSDAVVLRLKSSIETEFRLEAGLIAEAMQKIDGVECECIEEINKRIGQVVFSVFYSN